MFVSVALALVGHAYAADDAVGLMQAPHLVQKMAESTVDGEIDFIERSACPSVGYEQKSNVNSAGEKGCTVVNSGEEDSNYLAGSRKNFPNCVADCRSMGATHFTFHATSIPTDSTTQAWCACLTSCDFQRTNYNKKPFVFEFCTADTPTPPPPPPPSSSNCGDAIENEHFELVNELRLAGFTCTDGTQHPPRNALIFDCRLRQASKAHSQDMANNNYFSHYSQNGDSPWDRADDAGVEANGENIAAGRATAQQVLDQWKGSPGHCNNMMKENFRYFGVGYGYSASATYKHYWTQMFANNVGTPNTLCCGSLLIQEDPEEGPEEGQEGPEAIDEPMSTE